MHPFSERRFRSLSPSQQQRHCVRLLRSCYEGGLDLQLIQEYNTICEWMGLTPLSNSPSSHEVSDRYHQHLRDTGVELKESELLPQLELGDHSQPSTPALDVTVYLDRLRSAHNVGSILRTVEALQLGSVVLGGHTPGPENHKVEAAAMGCADWVACSRQEIEHCPHPLIAIETVRDATPLCSFSFPSKCTLMLGNEELGIHPDLLAKADHYIKLPLAGRKNSLNVANAFAIVAWEIHRQHRLLPAGVNQ